MENLGNIAGKALDAMRKRVELTPEQTRAFEAECQAYDAEVDRAKGEIFKMISHMPAPGVDQDPRTAAAVYWDLLKGELSPENIALVCRAAMRKEVNPDSDFRPIAGRLISYGRAHFQCREAVRIDPRRGASVAAKRVAPCHELITNYGDEQRRVDERARIGHQMRALARDIRANTAEPMQLSKEALTRMSK